MDNNQFKLFDKKCLYCNDKLKLNNNRDIERKKFCCRSCSTKWNFENNKNYGMNGKKNSLESKNKMSLSAKKTYENGRKPINWTSVYKFEKNDTKYKFKGHNREHRVIMEKYLGRKLEYNEIVHHINENKSDNRIENLMVTSRSLHTIHHFNEIRISNA